MNQKEQIKEALQKEMIMTQGEFFIAYINSGHGWLFYEATSSEEYPVEYWMSLPQAPKNE